MTDNTRRAQIAARLDNAMLGPWDLWLEFNAHGREDITWLLAELSRADAEVGRLTRAQEALHEEISRLQALAGAGDVEERRQRRQSSQGKVDA